MNILKLNRELRNFSMREWRFYINHLIKEFHLVLPKDSLSSPYKCFELLNSTISSAFPDEKLRGVYIEGIKWEYKKLVINDSEFKWLKENDIACYWAWAMLYQKYHTLLSFNKVSSDSILYQKIKNGAIPTEHKGRYELIIDYVDYIYFFHHESIYKGEQIQDLISTWKSVTEKISPFKWVNRKNKEQCEWAWNYIEKYKPAFCPTYCNPMGYNEKYLAIHSAFYLWHEDERAKKLFHLTMNKAWNQKKYRDAQVDKVPLNTYLTRDAKESLLELSKINNMKMHEVIEALIAKNANKKLA